MARGRRRRPREAAASASASASYHFPMTKMIPANPNHADEHQYGAPRGPFVPASHYPCYPCEKDFGTREDLDIHNEDFHGTDRFGCGFCFNKFETKAAKKTHRTKIHGVGAHQVE